MEGCNKCGRIPAYCNCKSFEPSPVKELSLDSIEHILEKHGFRGWASWVQSKRQASGIIEKYWVSYYCEIREGIEHCKGTEKRFATKKAAYMGILSDLDISVG